MKKICDKDHRHDRSFERLPRDQGSVGRHVCAGCAYERGYDLGIDEVTVLDVERELDDLPESQASAVRHKSPYVAFALGYADGLFDSYER